MQVRSGDFTPGWKSCFMTEYLSARWFESMRRVVKEFLRLGLVPYLYDENSYPSGLAGGHVSACVPDARSRYVGANFGEGRDGIPAQGGLRGHSNHLDPVSGGAHHGRIGGASAQEFSPVRW
jgi:hypothetical protein